MLSLRLVPPALLLFVSRVSFAADPIEGDATPWEAFDRHLDAESQGRRGWYVEGGASLGGCTGDLCRRVLGAGVGVGGRFGFGFRFAPLFSLGASLDLQSVPIDGRGIACEGSQPCRTHAASASWRALSIASRFHFTRSGELDPWMGLFAGGVTASAEAVQAGGDAPSRIEASMTGATLGLEAGLAWLPSPHFALTISARVLFAAWMDACYESRRETDCAEGESIRGSAATERVTSRDLPDLWSVSLGLRVMP